MEVRGPVRPPRGDVVLAGTLCALSLAQVLEEPIAGPVVSVLVAVVSTAPLAFRSIHPVVAAVVGTAIWLVPTPRGYLLLGYVAAALLYFSVGMRVRSLRTVVAVVAAGVVVGAVSVLSSTQPPGVVVASALAVVGPAAAGRLVAYHRQQAARLEEMTDQLLRERDTAERAAVAEERSRIARELHDVVGHDLTVIALHADAAAAALARAPERASAPVAAIRAAAGDALREMRTVLGVLRSDGDGGLRPQPGLSDLPALVERSRAAGTEVLLALRWPSRPLPATVELAAYRVVQEALTNAGRHATGAAVQVRVDGHDGALVVEVADSGGRAAGPEGAGLGLVGMRERVRLLGGELTAGPCPGGGYAVTAVLPIAAAP